MARCPVELGPKPAAKSRGQSRTLTGANEDLQSLCRSAAEYPERIENSALEGGIPCVAAIRTNEQVSFHLLQLSDPEWC
jgi:hypothetical protein